MPASSPHRSTTGKIPISTIAFGTTWGTIDLSGQRTPVPVDEASLREIAAISGGQSFTATSEDQLRAVYGKLREQIGYETARSRSANPGTSPAPSPSCSASAAPSRSAAASPSPQETGSHGRSAWLVFGAVVCIRLVKTASGRGRRGSSAQASQELPPAAGTVHSR
ncbi:hypothetical protein GCM10023321_44850 [Pseudonocardia eucalypti]|uniref:Uncharacterized protein n=1 Tax=Pseudonocardia eucalypti TaxID=648755 RepID=A0ABP9QFN9_9PSEU